MRSGWLSSLVLLGCAAVGEGEGARMPETLEPPAMTDTVPEADPSAPPTVAEAAAPAGPTCTWERVEPRRWAALVPPPEDAACRPAPSRKRKAELRRTLRKEWMWKWPEQERLVVEHGCDPLGEALATVVFESSSGHGGSLDLLRLDHRDDGDWDATFVDYNHYWGRAAPKDPDDPWQADSTGVLKLRRGVLPGERVDRALRRAREALHLRAHEPEPPPPPPGTLRLGSYGFSSRDFHVDLRLVDQAGFGTQHYFGGYEGGDEAQAHRLALDLAARELWDLLDDDALVEALPEITAADPEVRAQFAAQLWNAHAREAEYGLWYLRERLFGLAAPLGDHEHVPALLDAIRPDAGNGPSEVRSRVLAINAIAEITGFDARYDADGQPRPVDAVAADVLAACGG